MSFGLLSGIGSVLGGLGGLFGGKKGLSPGQQIESTLIGARHEGEKYGFNPLTVLKSMGLATGTPSEPAPLASIQMITDGLKDVDDITSGDAARRRAADQLNLDLAQLKLDQARSGVIAVTPNYVVNGISGPSPLGVRPVRVATSHGGDLVGSGATAQGRRNGPFSSANLGLPDDSDPVAVPDDRLDRGTGIYLEGLHWKPAPGWSPASAIEDEYGDSEVVSTLYGLAKGHADLRYNVGRFGDFLWQKAIGSDFKPSEGPAIPEFYTHPQTGFTAKRRRFGM